MNTKAAITIFYEEIWNKQNKSRIADICLEDFSFRGSVGQTKRGHAGFGEYVDFITGALGDYRCDIQDIVAESDKAFAKMLFSGIHRAEFLGYAPTRRRVEWAGAALFTFRDGKIADVWVLGDVHHLIQQLKPSKQIAG